MQKKMQIFSKFLMAIGVVSLFSGFSIKPDANTKLSVIVSGIQNSTGNVHVLLFNSAVGYPSNPKKAYKHVKAKAMKGSVVIPIDDIPTGIYSVVSFHDKNINGDFDKSWFGSPKEDYGFSNIPYEFCGTPSFQQTSFSVGDKNLSVTVKLINI